MDTGIIDNDSKWRQAVGEITPDYQDVLFKKGFGGIIREAREKLEGLNPSNSVDLGRIEFYNSIIITSQGIIELAGRYADMASEIARSEQDGVRRE